MRNPIWLRVAMISFVLATPMVGQAQEVGVYFAAVPRATPAFEEGDFKPVGFLITATHYYSDSWFGITGEIGYVRDAVESAVFEGSISTFTGLAGLRFRPPSSKSWSVRPSVHFMMGVSTFQEEIDRTDFELIGLNRDPSSYSFATGAAFDFDLAPGKAIGVQWDAIAAAPNFRAALLWRLAIGAVFKF